MDLFNKAKVVRLRSHHDRYLHADDDEATVTQGKSGASQQAKWTVEFVGGDSNLIRLKSCYNRYLTASNKPYLLGLTGHKVVQDVPARLDSSVEWEPIREGVQVKLKTRYGNFLRANGGTYPYKNSVTHDTPHRTVTQDWVLWDLEVVDILTPKAEHERPSLLVSDKFSWKSNPKVTPEQSKPVVSNHAKPPERFQSIPVSRVSRDDEDSVASSYSSRQSSFSPRLQESFSAKHRGREIYYCVCDNDGTVNDAVVGTSFVFEGSTVQELTRKLEEETKLDGVIVCTWSPLTEKLHPIRINLPPNNAPMNVVAVPRNSEVAQSFMDAGLI